MKHMKLIFLALSISLLGLILTFSGINQRDAFAYFSATGNFYGGSLGLYGMYGGLGGLYGLYGLGGIYGGLYGGLYGLYGGMYSGLMGGGLFRKYNPNSSSSSKGGGGEYE